MTTYSIQLDDMDLALLPVPSLSYNHVLKKEQFEFQLLIKEEAEDPTVTHTCHICAIDVPTAFWSEHSAGAKHRANARIATAAIQRTSALITATPPPKTPFTTEQFCDSCTCIVDQDHEKTQAHKLSVTQDRMLFNLVMLYTGDVSDDQREKENKTDAKQAKKDKDKEVDVNVIKREVNHLSNIENDERSTANTPCEKDITDINLNVVELNVDQFSDVENEKRTTTKIPNVNIEQNSDEKILDGEIETIPSISTQLSTFQDEKSNAIHLTDQNEGKALETATIAEDNGEIKVKRIRTRRRKNKSQQTNIITTEDPNGNENANNREVHVPDPSNNGLDFKDAFVSYYPLVDESAVHYPFIKDMLQVRCLICDCVVPRAVYNRVTHLKGRPHAANVKKQLHIVKDAFILAKQQINMSSLI